MTMRCPFSLERTCAGADCELWRADGCGISAVVDILAATLGPHLVRLFNARQAEQIASESEAPPQCECEECANRRENARHAADEPEAPTP
jgi:hypothetical protein